MTRLDPGQSNVTHLLTLPQRLALVRCDCCHAEWEDMDAALHGDGYSELGCPNRCGRLTTPVYMPDGKTRMAEAC